MTNTVAIYVLSYFKVCTMESRFVPKYICQLCTPTDLVGPFMFVFIAIKVSCYVSTCSIVLLFIMNDDFCLENGQREVTSMCVMTSQYISPFETT